MIWSSASESEDNLKSTIFCLHFLVVLRSSFHYNFQHPETLQCPSHCLDLDPWWQPKNYEKCSLSFIRVKLEFVYLFLFFLGCWLQNFPWMFWGHFFAVILWKIGIILRWMLLASIAFRNFEHVECCWVRKGLNLSFTCIFLHFQVHEWEIFRHSSWVNAQGFGEDDFLGIVRSPL